MITEPSEVLPNEYHTKLKLNRANIFDPNSYLSKSTLYELHKRSLFAWRHYPEEKTMTEAMIWGSYIDALTTTPDEVDELVAYGGYDSYRSNEAKEWRDIIIADNRLPVLEKMREDGELAAKMLTEVHPISAEIFAASKTQVMLILKFMGVNLKGLVDLAPFGIEGEEPFLADLKTCNKFSENGFSKTMAEFGYHVQAGMYLALWNTLFPNDQRHRFKIVWQSSKYPFEVAVREVHRDDIQAGANYFKHLLNRVIEAAKLDNWPMAFPTEQISMRPTYASMDEEATIRNAEKISELPKFMPPTNNKIENLI